jgi:hypothetical protein
MQKKTKLFLVTPLLLMVRPAWAASTLCSGSYSLDPGVGIPSIAGCEQGDKIFSSFSSFINNGTPPSPDTIFVTFSGTSPAGPITDSFSSAGWINTTNTGSIFLYNYTQVDQVANPGYVITGFDLAPGSISFPDACASTTSGPACDSLQILTQICTNLATNTCTSSEANYGLINYSSAATFAVNQSYCYAACSGGSSTGKTSIAFDPALGITSIFVTNWVIVNNYDGNGVTLNGFANDYFEAPAATSTTPEPGTFLLLGTALSVVGLWRLRLADKK